MSVQDLFDQITSGDYVDAEKTFGSLVGERVTDALEQKKIAIASSLYNEAKEEEMDDEDESDESDDDDDDDDDDDKDED